MFDQVINGAGESSLADAVNVFGLLVGKFQVAFIRAHIFLLVALPRFLSVCLQLHNLTCENAVNYP